MIDMTPTKTLELGKTTLTRERGGIFMFTAVNGTVYRNSNHWLELLWDAALAGSGANEETQRHDVTQP